MSDDNNGSGYAKRDVVTQSRIFRWFEQHKKSLLSYPTRQDVCDALLADTGLKISIYTCKEYEKVFEVSRRPYKGRLKPGGSKTSKSSEILARALHTTMETLIKVISDDESRLWFRAEIDGVAEHLEAVKAVAQRRSLDTHSTPPTA